MKRFGWLAWGLSVAFLAIGARAYAGSVTDGIQVSVHVVRSCSVQTTGTGTTVDCGRGTRDLERKPRPSTPVVRTVSVSSTPGTITVNF